MTSPVDIRPDHLEIVQDILREHLPVGVKVWVFGSRANWTTKDSSDLDIALEGENKLSHKLLGALKDAFEDSALPYTVDVVDLNTVSNVFKQIVESQRVPLPVEPDGTKQQVPLNTSLIGKAASGGTTLTATSDRGCEVQFAQLLAEPVRNGIYKKKEFHGRGVKVVNMGELFANPRLRDVHMRRVELSESERHRLSVQSGDLLFARRSLVAEGAGKCSIVLEINEPTTFESSIIRARPDPTKADSLFLYYYFNSPVGLHALDTIRRHVAVAGITGTDLAQLPVEIPPLPEQRAIAHVLGTLDDKIELNRRMNETLEAMARALFKSWFVDFDPVRAKMDGRWRHGESLPGLPAEHYDLFPDRLVDSELGEVPEGWGVRTLDSIATFLNGLALQKYPATDGSALPVIKIAQIRAGHTIGADSASSHLPPQYVVHDGDVLFSWSGSLELDVWAGGEGALNQHLFKVTSQEYPKWLYYRWVREHLPGFREIAAGKTTTMGDIQRHHLSEALAVIPDVATLKAMDRYMAPLVDRSLAFRIESRRLATQRDALLPGLVSGEVGVGQ